MFSTHALCLKQLKPICYFLTFGCLSLIASSVKLSQVHLKVASRDWRNTVIPLRKSSSSLEFTWCRRPKIQLVLVAVKKNYNKKGRKKKKKKSRLWIKIKGQISSVFWSYMYYHSTSASVLQKPSRDKSPDYAKTLPSNATKQTKSALLGVWELTCLYFQIGNNKNSLVIVMDKCNMEFF